MNQPNPRARRISDDAVAARQQASRAADVAASARADQITEQLPDRAIRKRSVFTIRCQGCDGMTIAYLTYVDGRPLLWCQPADGRSSWDTRYLDVHHVGPSWAWCRNRAHPVLNILANHGALPGAGAKEIVVRVVCRDPSA